MPEKDMKNIKRYLVKNIFNQAILISLIPMATNCSSHKEGTTLVKGFFVKINELKKESGKTFYSWKVKKFSIQNT